MTPTSASASAGAADEAAAEQPASATAAPGPFVLNLCSSTTPMALAKLESPELKRFSFFVSRRFEEGRERFRLHMGYFSSLAEAEEWLSAVRDIYPGAWAGEAPGKKLRERAVAAAAAQAQHAAGPPPRSRVDARGIPAPPIVRAALPEEIVPARRVPTVHAAAPVAKQVPTSIPTLHERAAIDQPPVIAPVAANNSRAPIPRPALPTAPQVSATVARARASAPPSVAVSPSRAAGGAVPAPAIASPGGRTSASVQSRPPAARVPVPAGTPRARSPGPITNTQAMLGTPRIVRTALPASSAVRQQAQSRTNIAPQQRSAAAQSAAMRPAAKPLQQTSRQASQPSSPRPVQQPAGPRKQGPRPSVRIASKTGLPDSNVREVLDALDEATGETRMMPAPRIADPQAARDVEFTDTQVLRLLEARRADGSELPAADVESGAIALLKPDDTGTRRALKEAVAVNAPVWFAVQLQWSVQAVELANVPPLAIFSAYTLYTVEGSREGRKWYGLRLGFFSDAISAKQVAYYVRSEFTSVAVVPVSPEERTRATESDGKVGLRHAFPKKTRVGPVEEFKLIDADEPLSKLPGAPLPQPGGAATSRGALAPPAATKRRSGNRVRAHEPRAPQTLEETLEILGAGELEIDNGKGESLNESGVRHLRVQVQKNTPFSRLLERLTERVRKS